MPADPVRPHAEGAVVAVRVVPGASRAAVVGLHGGELKVRVCSPPVDGRANEELAEVLADALGLKPRDLRLVAGHTARSKQFSVPLEPEEVRSRIRRWTHQNEGFSR